MCTRNGAKRALGYTFHHVWLSALLNSLSCMPVELPLPFTHSQKKQMRPPNMSGPAMNVQNLLQVSVSLPSFPMVFPKSFSNFWVISNASYVTTLGRDGFLKGQTAVNEQDTIIIKRGSQAIRRHQAIAFKAISASCRSKLCARANSSSFRRAPWSSRCEMIGGNSAGHRYGGVFTEPF